MATSTHRFFGSVAEVVRDGEAAARAAAHARGAVCGWLGPGAPVEVIAAAGLHAMELSAGEVRATPLADAYMEDLFDPVVRGVFERLLRGEFNYLSALVLPRGGDSVHRLYYYMCELRRVGAAALPDVVLCDVSQAPGAAGAGYSADRLAELHGRLAALGGVQADEGRLSKAIAESQQRRELLQEFARRRREGEIEVSGGEALGVFAAARVLPREAFVEQLAGALAGAPPSRPSAAPRIVIAGSAHDDGGLHGAIEAAGGQVVGDFHAAGELAIGAPIGGGAATLHEHYRAGVWTPRGFGDAAVHIARFAGAARADAVVFSYFPVEEALTWDYPEQKKALEAAGVATLRLPDQARPYDGAPVHQPLAQLIAALRARRG